MKLSATILSDSATPEVARLMQSSTPEKLAETLRPTIEDLWNYKLKILPPNKNFPGSSTGFWEKQADSVKGYVEGGSLRLLAGTGEGGLVRRFWGGAVTAKDKALTIPAREEYYGQAATKFQNLKMVFFKSGAMALVEVDATVKEKQKGRRKKGEPVKFTIRETGGLVAYWLVGKGQSTRPQEPNPNVMPGEDEIAEASFAEIVRTIKL